MWPGIKADEVRTHKVPEKRTWLGVSYAGLSRNDQALVTRLLTEPCPFIDHPLFRSSKAEQRLFGEPDPPSRAARPWCNAAHSFEPEALPQASPPLSEEMEKRLFMRLNYARWRIACARRIAGRRLTNRTIRELLFWSACAEDVRAAIVRANMPLVLAMAKRARLMNVDFAELISEGNMALLRSVDKFDISRGFKFSTYGCRAILKSFSRVALRTSRYRGRFPTEFDPSLEKSDFLDHCRAESESNCMKDLREIINQNLADLNDVERTVIRARFALDAQLNGDQPPMPKTLEEVGHLIGVTKERVRQIQNRALAKLRAALEQCLAA